MENKTERKQRELEHFKKRAKRLTHPRSKRAAADKEKNWKNHLLDKRDE